MERMNPQYAFGVKKKIFSICARVSLKRVLGVVIIFNILVGTLFFTTSLQSYTTYNIFGRFISDLTNEARNGYVIDTPGCVVPDFDENHPSIGRFKYHNVKLDCYTGPRDLTYSRGLDLYFDLSALVDYKVHLSNIRCFYTGIERITQSFDNFNSSCDRNSRLKTAIEITGIYTTRISEDAILVYCNKRSDSSPTEISPQTFYKNVHYFFQPRRSENNREKFKTEGGWKKNRGKLNVLFAVTDSVSRVNMKRHMPKTFKYLTNNLDVIDLKGLVKVGDNTLPNIIAILSGFSRAENAMNKCPENNVFDDCTFLWDMFSEKGYSTIFAEDHLWLGSFRYTNDGYVKEPTDYYLHPFYHISEEYIGHMEKTKTSEANMCQRNKMSLNVLYDYILEGSRSLHDVPYFGFMQSSTHTHNILQYAAPTDEPSLNFLKSLSTSGALDNTVLFFMSDHGLRYGDIRSTYIGYIEERMPYHMIVFPKWFKDSYPKAWHNLKINQNRLTCPYDIHQTVKDILYQRFDGNKNDEMQREGHGQSLFQEVSDSRTCFDASISEHLCVCDNKNNIPTNNEELRKPSIAIMKKINDKLKKFDQCSQLQLNKIVSARASGQYPESKHKIDGRNISPESRNMVERKQIVYNIVLETVPGKGHLEASVVSFNNTYTVSDEMSRINRYDNQSHCVRDIFIVKFCYCKEFL